MHVAVVGGSDAGIEAARRCGEHTPDVDVTVLAAEAERARHRTVISLQRASAAP